jgi:hypothetical protein
LACERNRPAGRSGRYPDQFGAGTSGFIGEWTRIQSNDKSPRIDKFAGVMMPFDLLSGISGPPATIQTTTPQLLQNGTAKTIAGEGPCHQTAFSPRGVRIIPPICLRQGPLLPLPD